MPTPTAPAFTRPALAPGLLGAVALIVGVVMIDSGLFVGFRYVVSILALIMLVFAVRGRTWWALPLLAAVAVVWNPVVVIPLSGQPWAVLQFVAAGVFIAAGIVVKVPTEDATAAGRATARR